MIGRPTKYDPATHPERAFKLMLLNGATLEHLAAGFGVDPSTVDDWIAAHEEFAIAIENGRTIADAEVAHGLYRRAVGYDRKCEKVFKNAKGEVVKTEHWTEHMPPESQAALKWLNNRQPDRWRHQKDPLDDDGDDMAPLPVEVTVKVKSARVRADAE